MSTTRRATADQYRTLIVAYRNNAAVRLSDVARISDGVEDVRNIGMANGKPAILVILFRQPGANIIDTVDSVKALLPQLQAALPPSINLDIANDRTGTIRASLRDVERTMMISILLVMFVVYLFLRDGRAAIIPSVAVPLSLIGTFGAMYLLGYSLDNLSLMALTVATGFVVDDAIVVLENITRHIEAGMPRLRGGAAGRARGRLHRAVDEPVADRRVHPDPADGRHRRPLFQRVRHGAVDRHHDLAARVADDDADAVRRCSTCTGRTGQQALLRASERAFQGGLRLYDRTLQWALANPGFIMIVLAVAVVLNFYLYFIVPKGFFPAEDTGQVFGGIRADQSISFQLMKQKFAQFMKIVSQDPAVQTVAGTIGGGGGGPRGGATNTGNVFIQLKPLAERGGLSTDDVIERPAAQDSRRHRARACSCRAGATCASAGARASGAYQYTIQADTLDELDDLGAQDHRRAAGRARTGGRQFRPRRQGAGESISRSTAPPRRGSASAPPRSTTRSTTRSASARSRRSTTSSTSITS